MKPITFPTLDAMPGAIHVLPDDRRYPSPGRYEAWLDRAPGEHATGLIIGSGDTPREALEAGYQFLVSAAAAVLVRR